MATFALEQKSIVLIGGTSGLGLSAARAFLAAGARVVIVGRDPAKVETAEKELGRNVIGLAAAAKAAAIGLTKSAAAYYAPAGIRFNVLAPALVATPMSQRAQEDADILSFIASKQPLDGGRIGHASDLDGAALYFMSDDSKFV